MSSNSEIFFNPGLMGLNFLLSLFGLVPYQVDPALYWLLSLVVALLFWGLLIRVGIAVIKKLTGFDRAGGRY